MYIHKNKTKYCLQFKALIPDHTINLGNEMGSRNN